MGKTVFSYVLLTVLFDLRHLVVFSKWGNTDPGGAGTRGRQGSLRELEGR